MGSNGYITLSRQSGLMSEMRVVANNIANAATTGYRQEGVVFSEFVQATEGQASLSMARAQAHNTSLAQGTLTQTNGPFDLAIEGDGFFMVETPNGDRLTRAGNFAPNANGDLVNMNGYRVLDAGGSPVFVPGGTSDITIASDGTISTRDGVVGQIGLYDPNNRAALVREDGVLFRADDGVKPSEAPRVLQGFLEGSNVNPILQVARMVDIQRGYELGQSFLDSEDQRIRDAVKTLIR
ncbi:MAG: flagellar hook-basal body complex protein [Planctomycetes bacterium]|nr:flagellar hook-basal body complex protein [Planctomycetota bacterium]